MNGHNGEQDALMGDDTGKIKGKWKSKGRSVYPREVNPMTLAEEHASYFQLDWSTVVAAIAACCSLLAAAMIIIPAAAATASASLFSFFTFFAGSASTNKRVNELRQAFMEERTAAKLERSKAEIRDAEAKLDRAVLRKELAAGRGNPVDKQDIFNAQRRVDLAKSLVQPAKEAVIRAQNTLIDLQNAMNDLPKPFASEDNREQNSSNTL